MYRVEKMAVKSPIRVLKKSKIVYNFFVTKNYIFEKWDLCYISIFVNNKTHFFYILRPFFGIVLNFLNHKLIWLGVSFFKELALISWAMLWTYIATIGFPAKRKNLFAKISHFSRPFCFIFAFRLLANNAKMFFFRGISLQYVWGNNEKISWKNNAKISHILLRNLASFSLH